MKWKLVSWQRPMSHKKIKYVNSLKTLSPWSNVFDARKESSFPTSVDRRFLEVGESSPGVRSCLDVNLKDFRSGDFRSKEFTQFRTDFRDETFEVLKNFVFCRELLRFFVPDFFESLSKIGAVVAQSFDDVSSLMSQIADLIQTKFVNIVWK